MSAKQFWTVHFMEMTNTKQYLTGFPYESDYSVSVMVVYSAVKGITGSYTLWGEKNYNAEKDACCSFESWIPSDVRPV